MSRRTGDNLDWASVTDPGGGTSSDRSTGPQTGARPRPKVSSPGKPSPVEVHFREEKSVLKLVSGGHIAVRHVRPPRPVRLRVTHSRDQVWGAAGVLCRGQGRRSGSRPRPATKSVSKTCRASMDSGLGSVVAAGELDFVGRCDEGLAGRSGSDSSRPRRRICAVGLIQGQGHVLRVAVPKTRVSETGRDLERPSSQAVLVVGQRSLPAAACSRLPPRHGRL